VSGAAGTSQDLQGTSKAGANCGNPPDRAARINDSRRTSNGQGSSSGSSKAAGATSGGSSYATACHNNGSLSAAGTSLGPNSSLSQFRDENAAGPARLVPLGSGRVESAGLLATERPATGLLATELLPSQRDFVYGDETRLSLYRTLEQTNNKTLPTYIR
jgi:hypothetical protein